MKKKISLQGYLEFTSVLAVFMQGMVTRDFVIDLKLFYFILIINSAVLYSKYTIKLHKYLFLILFFLVVHSICTFFIYSNYWVFWVSQIIGISFMAIYYYNIFALFDLKRMFRIYLRLSIIFCILAIILFQFGLFLQNEERLDGLMTEPSIFIYVNIPALFYFLKSKKWIPALLLLVSFVLAQSSLGFIAIIIMLLFLIVTKGNIKYLGLSIIPLLIFFSYLKNNERFNDRFESIIENLKVYQTNKIAERVNVSSFVLLKNSYMAYKNFIDHPLGTGIGSFENQHDKYLEGLKMPKFIHILKLYELNRIDASSLFLRGMSDLGVFWLLFVILVCWLGFYANSINYNDEIKKNICISSFIYILIYLIRGGHYFPEEMYFFVFLFFFNLPKIKIKTYANQN